MGLQVLAAYWAVKTDGTYCNGPYIDVVSYLAYAIVVLNFIAFYMLRTSSLSRMAVHVLMGVNLGMLITTFFFSIDGYNETNCSSAKALLKFYFLAAIIATITSIVVLFARFEWA